MLRIVRFLVVPFVVSSLLIACSSKQDSSMPHNQSQDSQVQKGEACPRGETIEKRLSEINHCQTSDDCTHYMLINSRYSCPVPVNRGESLTEIDSIIDSYVEQKCPNAPMTDCDLGKGFSCEKNQCVQK